MRKLSWPGALGLAMLAALIVSRPAAAQTLYGALVGNVTDETALAVPGATVKITHAETNQTPGSDDELDRRVQLPEHPDRHVSGRRGTHRISIGEFARHRRPPEHVGAR